MEQKRSSLLSSLFPWRSPFVIKFVVVKGGIEVQLFRNGRRITRWRATKLRRVLPESLVKWIDENQIATGPRPHPLTRQFWQYLSPLASQKLLVDTSELVALQEVSQPAHFALIWEIDQANARIQGKYQGANNYLGLSWFQTGNLIWPLFKPLAPNIAIQFEQLVAQDLVIPLPEAKALLNSTIPALQPYFSTRADFQLISDFALNVIVQNTQSGRLILTLESNYHQLLPTLSIPQQSTDFLLAQQALIQFPHQALTPVLMHLLQGKGTPVSLQGEDIPLFISEQLPVMRHYHQISDDMAQKILQAHPIVSIATLPASFASPVRTGEQGIGKYSVAATYKYQQHMLNMHELLDAHRRKQRFINQHGIWFEWPADAHLQAQRIRQSLVPRVLQPAEVMGLDTRQLGQWQQKPPAYTIQPEGVTPLERAQSLFRQLQYHGVPGGIFGDPAGLVNMLFSACENLVRDNRQARILWLTTSNKKGAVTRAINASSIQRNVAVASPVTLRDNASLFFQSWTLVIFHGLDQLQLEKSPEVWKFPQLKWQQAFLTIHDQHQFDLFMMQILHLPEQYSLQFRERYLFDPTRSHKKIVLPGPSPASTRPPIARPPEVKPTPAPAPATQIVSLFSTHEITITSKTSPLPLQPKKTEKPRTVPATPVPSRSSTQENKIASKISPLPPVIPKFVPSPSLSFWEQARQWQDVITHERVPLVKFEHDAPTYLNMQRPEMLEFYFYWRSEIRNTRYLDTDIGYILVHTYEAIAHIGFANAAAALNRLIDLWAHYRHNFSILDKLLIPWIGDFCAVHYSVSYRVMDWYTRLLNVPDYAGEAELLAEAWLRQGGDWATIPSAVLYALIGWQPSLLLSAKNLDQHTLYARYHRALTAIDDYLHEEKGISGLIERYGQGKSIAIERVSFTGALVERRYAPIAIERINSAFTSSEFHQAVIAILQYADYVYRKAHGMTAALPAQVRIDKNWEKAIEAALTNTPSAQSVRPVDQIEQKAVYETKLASAPVVNRPSPVNRPAQTTLENIRSRSMSSTERPTIELNPAKIAQLHEESEYLQERLTVEETAPSLPAIAVPPVLPVQSVPAVKQEPAQQFERTDIIARAKQAAEAQPETDRSASASLARSNTQESPRNYARLAEEFAGIQPGPSSLPPLLRSESKGDKKSSQKTEQKHSTQLAAASSITRQPDSRVSSQAPSPIQQEPEQMSSLKEAIALPHKPVLLNQEAISKLREESEHLQERLTIEEEDAQEPAEHPVTVEVEEAADVMPGSIEPAPVISAADQVAPEVDEDWQMIYPRWSTEHWEILRLLCQGQIIQFTAEERSKRRPISLLLDEINSPVDEHLNDLLIDAETQTLAPHLRSTVEQLVHWYYSLESR